MSLILKSECAGLHTTAKRSLLALHSQSAAVARVPGLHMVSGYSTGFSVASVVSPISPEHPALFRYLFFQFCESNFLKAPSHEGVSLLQFFLGDTLSSVDSSASGSPQSLCGTQASGSCFTVAGASLDHSHTSGFAFWWWGLFPGSESVAPAPPSIPAPCRWSGCWGKPTRRAEIWAQVTAELVSLLTGWVLWAAALLII